MKFGKSESVGAADKTRLRADDDGTQAARTRHRTAHGVTTSAAHSPVTGPDWDNPQEWSKTQSAAVQVGSIIKDRYVLQALLGKGAMGVVYEARDLLYEEFGDRDPFVAIKVLADEFRQHADLLKGLQREARRCQDLAHPNIVTVRNFDRDGTTVFMSMELLKGEPLDTVIEKHPQGLPKERALAIVIQMAGGLAFAHAKAIVHSDFKPGNVFLEPQDHAKVLDFGIARAAPAAGDRNVLEADGLIGYTKSYASLEMLTTTSPVTPADDVYALAIVAYELLTGAHPFDGKPADQAKQEGLKPRPVPELKRRQWKALVHGLEFERANRPADAAAFMRELQGPTPVKKSIAAVMVFLVIISGFLAVRNLTQDDAGPEVRFAQLSPEIREQFNDLLVQGDAELEFDPFNSALYFYEKAYQLHERNPVAEKRLEKVADLMIASAPNQSDENELRIYLRDINTMLGRQHLRKYEKLIRKRQAVERQLAELSVAD